MEDFVGQLTQIAHVFHLIARYRQLLTEHSDALGKSADHVATAFQQFQRLLDSHGHGLLELPDKQLEARVCELSGQVVAMDRLLLRHINTTFDSIHSTREQLKLIASLEAGSAAAAALRAVAELWARRLKAHPPVEPELNKEMRHRCTAASTVYTQRSMCQICQGARLLLFRSGQNQQELR